MLNTSYSYRVLEELEIYRQIFAKYSYKNFMRIRPVGDKLFHANRRTDGRTDMSTLIVGFEILRMPLKKCHWVRFLPESSGLTVSISSH